MMDQHAPTEPRLRCGFCGKSGNQVKKLISGGNLTWLEPPLPQVIICNECVELCMEICAHKDEGWRDEQIKRLRELAEPPEDDQTSN